ncbi:MAG: hypothetical protein ACOCWH_02280, partial [Spirochaetota bacterium]
MKRSYTNSTLNLQSISVNDYTSGISYKRHVVFFTVSILGFAVSVIVAVLDYAFMAAPYLSLVRVLLGLVLLAAALFVRLTGRLEYGVAVVISVLLAH